jgi:hypothetical protein
MNIVRGVVSEELIASIFKVRRVGGLRTILAVSNN